AAATRIARALKLWERESPDESALLREYCRTSPPPPDWKQPRALAEAMFAVIVFLARRERLVAPPVAAPIVEVVAELEWLDRQWLAAAIATFLRDEMTASQQSERPSAARPPALTPLQRHIVGLLELLLAGGTVALPDEEITSERNALALFAALAANEPSLASQPATPSVIKWFLRSRAHSGDAVDVHEQQQTHRDPGIASSSSRAPAARVLESRFAGIVL